MLPQERERQRKGKERRGGKRKKGRRKKGGGERREGEERRKKNLFKWVKKLNRDMEKQKQGKMENKGKLNKYKDSIIRKSETIQNEGKQTKCPAQDTRYRDAKYRKKVQSKNII